MAHKSPHRGHPSDRPSPVVLKTLNAEFQVEDSSVPAGLEGLLPLTNSLNPREIRLRLYLNPTRSTIRIANDC
jgi:hypothetical protein